MVAQTQNILIFVSFKSCVKVSLLLLSLWLVYIIACLTVSSSFYRTSSYASAVLAVVILFVRPSIRHTRAL